MSVMFLMMVVTEAIPPRMGRIGIIVRLLCWGLLFCERSIPCKTRANNKRKLVFVRKTRRNLIKRCDCTKTYSKIHFRMSYKTEKGPASRSLKISAQNANRNKSYCARRRALRDCLQAHNRAEKQALLAQSTVCRGMLSEFHNTFMTFLFPCLNPLYIVECFRRHS